MNQLGISCSAWNNSNKHSDYCRMCMGLTQFRELRLSSGTWCLRREGRMSPGVGGLPPAGMRKMSSLSARSCMEIDAWLLEWLKWVGHDCKRVWTIITKDLGMMKIRGGWRSALDLKGITSKASRYSLQFVFRIKDLCAQSRYFSNTPRTFFLMSNINNA